MSEKDYIVVLMIPAELYVAFIKRMAKFEICKSHCGLDCVNETLYREGFIDEETYQKFKERYRKRLIDVVREKEQPSVKVEVNAAKFEVQKSTFEISKSKKHPDYSKMSLEELQNRINHLRDIGDSTELQFAAAEIKKRLGQSGIREGI